MVADPLAPSTVGGRWAPPPNGDHSVAILYTSLQRDGSLAEFVSFLADLTPIPTARRIKVARLGLSTSRTLRLARAGLETLGVDMQNYGVRDYARTQEIGAALTFLNFDGLIAPSARWGCDNRMIFTENHALSERFEVVETEAIEWRAWAEENGYIPPVE